MFLLRKFCLLCDTIDDNGVSTQRHQDEDNRAKWFETWDGTWFNVDRLCPWEVKQLRDNWKQACMCIELYSDKYITQSTQIWIVSHKLMPGTLRFPQSRGSGHCCTQSRICSPPRSLSTICGTGISTICSGCPGFPTHTTHTKSSSWSIVCACFSTTLYQPWIHSMESLHGFAQIRFALHWTEDWTKDYLFAPEGDQTVGFPLAAPVNMLRVCAQSDSPCLLQLRVQSLQCQCLSDLVLCEVTVNQIHKHLKSTEPVRIVTKREFTWHW